VPGIAGGGGLAHAVMGSVVSPEDQVAG
jgi:hypothetical protein